MSKERIAAKVTAMAPSGIRAFFDLVLGMKDVISLGVGEPDFVTPWNIRETGIYALEEGYTSYTSNKGLYKLRLQISRFLKSQYGLTYCPDEEILITVGVSEGLDLAVRALCNPGDEFVIPQPSYVSYGPVVELAGGVPVFLPTSQRNGFRFTARDLDRACSRKTKGIILNYPNNPTGASYSAADLKAIQSVCRKRGLTVISDEVYADLSYETRHTSFPSLPGARGSTVYLNGFSKSYAMTGWRLGFACGPKDIIAAMTKIHQYTILCAPIVSQMAACEALFAGKRSVEQMTKEYRRRRDFVVEQLDAMGLSCPMPEGAFYVFPSIKSTGRDSLSFANALLKEQKVAVVPGVAFGAEYNQFVRMSYATGYEQLKEAMRRLEVFVRKRA